VLFIANTIPDPVFPGSVTAEPYINRFPIRVEYPGPGPISTMKANCMPPAMTMGMAGGCWHGGWCDVMTSGAKMAGRKYGERLAKSMRPIKMAGGKSLQHHHPSPSLH
jgi:hypothetical protein